jgi:hypothetical protein
MDCDSLDDFLDHLNLQTPYTDSLSDLSSDILRQTSTQGTLDEPAACSLTERNTSRQQI